MADGRAAGTFKCISEMRKQILLIVCGLLFSFETWAQLNGSGFYRIRNGATATNEDRISIVDNMLSYNEVVRAGGGGTNLLLNRNNARQKAINKVSEYLKQDIKLVTDYISNPSTVIFMYKYSNTQYDLRSQGTGLVEITTGVWNSSYGDIDVSGFRAIIGQEDGMYTASVNATVSSVNLGTFYLLDTNSEINVDASNTSTSAKWYIEPITSDGDNYFAAKPAEKMEEGRRQLTRVIKEARTMTNGRCRGVFYWEPQCLPGGYKLGAFDHNAAPTAIMEAFVE